MQPGGVMGEDIGFEDGPCDRTLVERRDPRLGTVVDGRFQLDFRIAEGGFGAIYCATALETGRAVALKILHANLSTDPRVVARFKREAAALTALCDPHTVRAYELGEARDGTLFIVMELLEGVSLYEHCHARGPLPWREAAQIAVGICSSLAEAHALGIVHRDLKPSNIHLEPRAGGDFVKVLDFGIAKVLESSDLDFQEITNAGQTIGTFDYMSPEQIVGGRCTNRSDIYTLGVVMYEMLGGRRPYAETTNPAAMLNAILAAPPPPVSTIAEVPIALEQLVGACLEREPLHRPETVHAIATVLARLLATEPVESAPLPDLSEASSVVSRADARGSEPMLRLPKAHPVPGFRGWQPMVDLAAYGDAPFVAEPPPLTRALLAEGSVADPPGAREIAVGVRPDRDAPETAERANAARARMNPATGEAAAGLEAGVRLDSIPDRGPGARIAARMPAVDGAAVWGAERAPDVCDAAPWDAAETVGMVVAEGGAAPRARTASGLSMGARSRRSVGAMVAGEALWMRIAMGAAAVAAAAAITQCI